MLCSVIRVTSTPRSVGALHLGTLSSLIFALGVPLRRWGYGNVALQLLVFLLFYGAMVYRFECGCGYSDGIVLGIQIGDFEKFAIYTRNGWPCCIFPLPFARSH